VLVACGVASAQAGQMYIIDEEDLQHLQNMRVRRQAPEEAPIFPGAYRQAPQENNYNRPEPVDTPVTYKQYKEAPPGQYGEAEDLQYANSDHKGYYKPGKVGPVYTFVKTDPYAHVKWGVRHVAGKKYAHGR
jgi:hypothetical protein